MKLAKNRQAVKRLFVLGAGASYSASRSPHGGKAITAPLDVDFSRRIAGLELRKPLWVGGARDRLANGWKDRQGDFSQFSLEEAVMRQLSHLEFIGAIHPRRGRGAVTDIDWLSDITHLMCFVLKRARESSHCTYRLFSDKVFPQGVDPEDYSDRVVTFNYDDLMDRHVVARVGPGCTYFDQILANRDAGSPAHAPFDHPLLVKLHGSVNWRCSEDEFNEVISSPMRRGQPHRIESIWYDAKGSPSPADKDYPLMIPPLPSKPITSVEIFRYLWTKAYEYLYEAEHLIVCGYSLPDADRLARSLFGNFSNSRLREITVVDPDPAVITKWRMLLARKSVGRARWTYFPDFREFVDQLDS